MMRMRSQKMRKEKKMIIVVEEEGVRDRENTLS